MKVMNTLKTKSVLMLIAFTFFTFPFYAQNGSLLDDMTLTLNKSNSTMACPGDPLYFEVTDNGPVPISSGLRCEWFYSQDNISWTSRGIYKTQSYSMEMGDSDFYIKVNATLYSLTDGSILAEKEIEMKVSLSQNCTTNICHQTTTGEYFNGTDFNLNGSGSVNWSTQPPSGLEEYFSNQYIEFSVNTTEGSLLNENQLGYPLYIDDSLGVNPNNNFFVKSNVNTNLFSLKFPNEIYKGKTYRFTMRFYLIIPKGCEIRENTAKIMTRTGHGTATQDLMDIEVYYESDNGKKSELIANRYVTMDGSDVAKYEFYNDIYPYVNTSTDNIFRFEIVYYGSMPANSTADFTFQPYFEQFPNCAIVAVDYISAEAASVCVSPRSECVDNSILVNAAGFPRGSDYVWTKYKDNTYSEVVEWRDDEVTYELDKFDKKEKAYIKMLDAGIFYYRISDGINSIDFSLVGTECGNAVCPTIDGDINVCVSEFPYQQNYSLKDESVLNWLGTYGVDYTYRWNIISPDGLTSNESKVYLNTAADQKTAMIEVKEGAKMSGSFSPDKNYILQLSAYKVYNGNINTQPECTESMYLWIYQQPNISTVNLKTKDKTDSICAATASDTIIIENKENILGYQWNWTGASMNEDGIIKIDGFNKSSLCDGSVTNYPVNLEVVNGTCKASLQDNFYVHTPDGPTIDCSDLSEDSVYYLSPSSLDTSIFLPIPSFSTSCDENPILKVDIHFDADEDIHDMDSSLSLSQTEIAAGKIPFTFSAGIVYIDYTLTDGCGKTDQCNVSVEIRDTTSANIDCSLIANYNANITNQEGCTAIPGFFSSELPILKPDTLRDLNFQDTIIMIPGVYAGRSSLNPDSDPGLDPTKYSTTKDLNDAYEIGVTYLLWSFTDPSGNVSYCNSKITVVNDRELFDCSTISDIRTTVNKNSKREYKYASAQPQGTRNPDTEYILENILKIPEVSELYCEGPVQLEIRFTGECVDDDGNLIANATDSLISSEDLLIHRFPIGVTNITYKFTDKNDTTRTCSQQIIIASLFAPIPNNCPQDMNLYVGNNCTAKWNATLDDVPTATIPYFKEVKYMYDNCNTKTYKYEELNISKSLSTTYDTTGYPFKVCRISNLDEQWEQTVSSDMFVCENKIGSSDSVGVKMTQHRNSDNSVCAEDINEQMAVKVTNFSDLPSCITDSFELGRHEIIWYFDNGKGIIDSCITRFTVLDTIAPTEICGAWSEEDTFYVDTTCIVSASVVDLHIPTIDSLQATDNCTNPDQLKISWTRTFKESQINSLDDPYEMGITYIKWIVKDESGNSSYCQQTVTVLDTLAPFFDCSNIKTIEVFADADCEAKPEIVILAGLKTPTTDKDDPCSPTGDVITGVGVRSDKLDVMNDPYPKDTTYISWTFTDAAGNKSVPCVQMVIVKDTTAPVFADCGNLSDITIDLDADSCVASRDLVKKSFSTHTAKDNCDGNIEGLPMLTLADSSYTDLPDFFQKDTTYLISWVFIDNEKNVQICYQNLVIKDTTPPDLNGICPDDKVKNVAAKVKCTVSYDDLNLPELVVDDPCDGLLYPIVTGWISQKDGSVTVYRNEELKTAEYPIGKHHFSWLFTDKAGLQDSCEIDLNVTDSLDLILSNCDVDKDVIIVLNPGECSLSPDSLSKYIKIPSAYDLCDEDSILPIIERRVNGMLIVDENGNPIVWDSQDFPLGKTDIKWLFIDKLGVMKDSCEKSITVKTNLFDCSTLQSKVEINLLEELYATAAEVELAGLKEPEIIIDTCNAATLSFSRDDNMTREDNYQIGNTEVTWTFTYSFGDIKECKQTVSVIDMVPPTLSCPKVDDKVYQCYGNIPAAYQTYEEFEAAGGSISDKRKLQKDSFGVTEVSTGEMPCNYTLIRTYYIKDIRDTVVTCSQEFKINDTQNPVILTKLDTLVLSCEQDIPDIETEVIDAEDNCTAKSDIIIEKEERTDRSTDIHSCSYNNYTIWRSWTALDKCNHRSAPLTQVILIIDSVSPEITLPEGWRDTVLAGNLKNCQRIVPVLDTLLNGHVSDGCTLEDDITLWQEPIAGTLITKTTDVYLYAKDKCGNKDSVKVVILVDDVKNIVSLTTNSITSCGSDTSSINLWSQNVRYATGYTTVEILNKLKRVGNEFCYDCYKDSISEESLVYSNNRSTYQWKFSDKNSNRQDSIFQARVHLRKKGQSGLYYFVAMDTTTQCKDTAQAYLTILERPRVTLSSDVLDHCENDTFDLNDLIDDTNACINDMGSDITKSGWYIDDVEYISGTPVLYDGKVHTMYFYAENECGRSSSYDSYFMHCGVDPVTKEDSLSIVGTEENLKLWRMDNLHSKDSLLLVVHQRYVTDSIFLSTNPPTVKRLWQGDELELKLTTPYNPSFSFLYKISELYDGRFSDAFDKYGNLLDSLAGLDEADELITNATQIDNSWTFNPSDSALYYVLIGDGVCPAMPSNVVDVDVIDKLPTAITPFNSMGMNDVFLEGRQITVFDRYGNRIHKGNNGWDGTKKGSHVDPGVYYYEAEINGVHYKGTIEVVNIK